MPQNFLTLSDLPADVQAQVNSILAIPSAKRTASQTAFLNARVPHLSNVVIRMDPANTYIAECSGTSVPSNGLSGFAKNCFFYKTDAVAGTSGLYTNVGTISSCDFKLVTNA
jgi:hypothetical protein